MNAAPWSALSGSIAAATGLHFPPERWPDLERGLQSAAAEFGYDDLAECADWLLATPLGESQIQVLASHLTIGETYFFRDRLAFDALAGEVLPALIESRRGQYQRLRLWSAACCTGEEAYSLAMLLHQLLPDLAHWQITLLATDINPRFLKTAAAGVYGEWSFRHAPPGIQQRYFRRLANGRYELLPEIRNMVSFAPLNLVDTAPAASTVGTQAMDLILCRNVLMYFTPQQASKVVARLQDALLPGGWLGVSACDASSATFADFDAVDFSGLMLYRKRDETQDLKVGAGGTAPDLSPNALESATASEHADWAASTNMAEVGTMAADTVPQDIHALINALAAQGKPDEALALCSHWLATDKLNEGAHYLHALLSLEQGDVKQAIDSLRHVLYLAPDFVLAHFALGTLARDAGRYAEARRYFSSTQRLLAQLPPDHLLPESDYLSVAALTSALNAALAVLTNQEAVRDSAE